MPWAYRKFNANLINLDQTGLDKTNSEPITTPRPIRNSALRFHLFVNPDACNRRISAGKGSNNKHPALRRRLALSYGNA